VISKPNLQLRISTYTWRIAVVTGPLASQQLSFHRAGTRPNPAASCKIRTRNSHGSYRCRFSTSPRHKFIEYSAKKSSRTHWSGQTSAHLPFCNELVVGYSHFQACLSSPFFCALHGSSQSSALRSSTCWFELVFFHPFLCPAWVFTELLYIVLMVLDVLQKVFF
jgi:hypothetical protein